AIGKAAQVLVTFVEPLDAATLPALVGEARPARFVDWAGAVATAAGDSPAGPPAITRVAVVGGGDRASRAAASWRTAGFDVVATDELAAPDGPALLHVQATLRPSEGVLGAAFVSAAEHLDPERACLDVGDAVEL